jgi:hypothetical protein
MTDLNIVATSRTPKVILKAGKGTLLIEGESYPEDVTSFYEPVFAAVRDYLALQGAHLDVEIKLIYFNSSSARSLMELLDLMDAAAAGATVSIKWFCDGDDDITREFAEDISADIEHISINIFELKRDE